ncbi:MAG: hypothetical protein Q9227_006950 [Pyrenula ochraceoflavens]
MPKTESLEALLNASLRVSRPVAACSRCRAAKIKCDGRLPACTACERSGKSNSCSGANDDFAKGKERSYVAALESACERLERRIANVKNGLCTNQSLDSGDVSTHGAYNDSRPPLTRKAMSGGKQSRKEASEVDELVGDFGYLSINATSRDFPGFSDTVSFAKLMLFTCQNKTLPKIEQNLLPPRYAAIPLIQHYLDHIYVLMPFFSETDFMASVSAVYQDAGRFSRHADHFILRMVLAVSAASLSRSKSDSNMEEAHRHASAAIDLAEGVIIPGSVTTVQWLLLLTQYALVDPEYFNCWDLIGVTSRAMVDLGVHQEPAADIKISRDQLEMRQRIYYCVFTLDSAMVNLPLSSVPDANRMNLPKNSLFLRSLNPSYQLFTIRQIQSEFYQDRYGSSRSPLIEGTAQSQSFQAVINAYNWFCQVPPTLPPQQSRILLLFFRLELFYTQVLALSSSPRVPNNGAYNKTIVCAIAAEYILQLAPSLNDPDWHPFFTYPEALRVSFVANTILDALWSNYEAVLGGWTPPISGNMQPPPPETLMPPLRDVRSNISRVLDALNSAQRILSMAHQRWGQCMLQTREKFEKESAVMISKLNLRLDQEKAIATHSVSPPSQQQPMLAVTEPLTVSTQMPIQQHPIMSGYERYHY